MKTCRKKKPRQAAALLGIMICLTGCANSSPTPITQPSESLSVIETALQSEPRVGEIVSQEPANTEPTRIVETVNENLHIDATVEEYPADGLAGVYVGEPVRITKEEIQRFLEYCGTTITSTKESSDSDMDYYNGVCENGAVFYAEQVVHRHPYSQFIYRNDEKCQFYKAYPIYTGEESFLTNSKYTVGWMFMEPKELSFATELEAEQNVRKALNMLGLSNLKLMRTLYCDHQTLEAAMQRITTHEDYGPLGAKVENNGYPVKEIWTAEDDAYVFSFGFSVQGVPMCYRYYSSGKTAAYTCSDVVVWYTKDGIVDLVVNTPWHVGEAEKIPVPIVPAQTALDIAKTKLGYDLMKPDKCVEEIRLEYHYVQDRDRWLLKPVWSVACSHKSGHENRIYDFINVDALTGDEL